MLTARQRDLLLMIDRAVQSTGCAPSYDEMRVALGVESKSSVNRLLAGLEERGFIRRLHNRARAIEVLKLPPRPDAPLACYSTGDLLAELARRGHHG